ncbi:ATP-binding cassette domain-containing protein [uncultured Amnibacterium sp.]|uniref:ATP-binding cassette domain-containing protein n=1 Tax=uncultured Amnibacterium sp. TaxID=1631851 RepID=UPI0035CA8D84
MEAVVEFQHVSKRFSGVEAVKDLDFRLVPGEVLCLLGENGAGKSTVIKMLTGLDHPTEGTILVDGKPTLFAGPREARAAGISTVFQDVGTLPLMTVGRNFVLGAEPLRGRWPFQTLDRAKANEWALREMRELGIRRVTDAEQLVGTLSGGERQALAIGRATFFGARVIVLDEPTAALGLRESATVLRLIERVRSRGVAVLFITHNGYHAHATGDRFVVLRRGESVAQFARGERTAGELMELMSGGEELSRLLTAGEHVDSAVG